MASPSPPGTAGGEGGSYRSTSALGLWLPQSCSTVFSRAYSLRTTFAVGSLSADQESQLGRSELKTSAISECQGSRTSV
jgi:hypothetical protein